MKIKHLKTEFEYFTPKWPIFGPIMLEIIAYIFIQYMNYHCAKFCTNILTNMDTTSIFPFLAIFCTKFWLFYPKNSNFWTYSAWHNSLYR